jgi:hypothetical protein
VPATARKINVTAEDLANEGGGGAYAELNVPWDGPILCVDVNDYDKSAKGGTKGWLVDYKVTTDSGKELDFSVHISFSAKARWKLIQWAEAHDILLEEGVNAIDPNDAIDTEAGGHIDFPRDDDGEPTSKYREIQEFFPLAELEEEDEDVERDGGASEETVAGLEEEDPEVL